MGEREAEIQARVEAATPGPWRYSWTQVPPQVRDDEPVMHCVTAGIPEPRERLWGMIVHAHEDRGNMWDGPNAAFIAHAREDIPYLLARVASLEGTLRKLWNSAEEFHPLDENEALVKEDER